MSRHPPRPFAAAALRRVAADLGLRTGFATDADRAALPHVVRYDALSRERMGDRRFERAYLAAIAAAERVAGRLGHLVEPVLDHRRVVVGREFRFASSLAALRFKLVQAGGRRGAGRPPPAGCGGVPVRWQEIIGGTVWLPKPPKPQEPTKPADTRAPSKP